MTGLDGRWRQETDGESWLLGIDGPYHSYGRQLTDQNFFVELAVRKRFWSESGELS